MKALPREKTIVRRLSVIFIMSLVATAWTFAAAAARGQTGQKSGQIAANSTLASALDAQHVSSAQQAPDKTTAPQPVEQASKPASQAVVRLGAKQPAPPKAAAQSSAARVPGASTLSPSPSGQTLKAPLANAPQPSGAAAAFQPEEPAKAYPPGYAVLKKKTTESLMSAKFTFIPVKALDPFVPFVSLQTAASPPPETGEPQGPLTPLQKMTLSEIERGLKAITWGALGRRAVIEDSTGKGYIVKVGTPAGEHGGVITQILDDRIVIQQDIWNSKARKRFPQDATIKLVKKIDADR